VLRVIARLNLGGPAHQARILTERLDRERFETLLVHGRVGSGEEEINWPGPETRASVVRLPGLGAAIRPLSDLRALIGLVRLVRRFRPQIVHTHTAKAGLLGRVAALVVRPRPVVLHTYHGHVLTGYFTGPVTAFYRIAERLLARVSDRLVGVSEATVDELVSLRIAPASKFSVVRLGLDLEGFAGSTVDRCAARLQLGLQEEDVVCLFVGRLVPVKRVDRLVEAIGLARRELPQLRLIVAGDGSERATLEAQVEATGLSEVVSFLGYRRELSNCMAAADIAVLSSDSEGTPVALIEGGAAGLPGVATAVGGVAEVLTPEVGELVPAGSVEQFAAALVRLARDPDLRREKGEAARARMLARFGSQRLVEDISRLYEQLLANDDRPVSSDG